MKLNARIRARSLNVLSNSTFSKRTLLFAVLFYLMSFLSNVAHGQIISTLAGQAWGNDGGPATNAGIKAAQYIAVDTLNNIYISDKYKIRKIDNSGNITTIAGTGIYGYSGDGGPATAARMLNRDIAVDRLGNIYFADWFRIRKINAAGIVSTVAGNGHSGFSGDGGPATAAEVSDVWGICSDRHNNLYFISNGRIRKIDTAGNISTVFGNGSIGFTADGVSARGHSLELFVYSDVLIDSIGNIYLNEISHLRMIDTSGILSTVVPSLVFGMGLDRAGRVYVGNSGSLDRITSSGTTSVAGTGIFGFSGDGGAATAAQVTFPWSITYDNNDNLVFGDFHNHRIRKIDRSGNISTIGGGNYGYGGPASAATLVEPEGMAEDGRGNIYFADSRLSVINKIDPHGNITIAAGNTFDGYTGDGGPATNAQLNYPLGVFVDADGTLYIADCNNEVVRKVDTSGIISTIVGTGAPGYAGDGGPATAAELTNVFSVCKDRAGNLFVVDQYNRVVRKIDTNGIINTYAGGGTSYGDSVAATAVQLDPINIRADRDGSIYVSTYYGTIRKIDTAGIITTTVGSSTYTSIITSDCNSAREGTVQPEFFAMDSIGQYYISSWRYFGEVGIAEQAYIRKTSTNSIVAPIAGIGRIGFSGDGGYAWNAEVGSGDIILSRSGDLVFGDYNSGIIRKESFTTNHPPRALYNSPVIVRACRGLLSMVDSALAAIDSEVGQNISFSVLTGPSHGTITIPHTCAIATGGVVYPSGFGYASSATFTGNDTIVVQIWDGIAYDTITVVAVVTAPSTPFTVTGARVLCPLGTTRLIASITGGTWSRAYGDTSLSIDTAGMVTAHGYVGSATFRYVVSATCGTMFADTTISIEDTAHSARIIGENTVCLGDISYLVGRTSTFSTSTRWFSFNTAIATIDLYSGLLTPVSLGTDTIMLVSYLTCRNDTAYKILVVASTPTIAITGPSGVCVGDSVTLSASTTGGAWSSYSGLCTVSAGGVVTGVSAGLDSIVYAVSTTCGSGTTSRAILIDTVLAAPTLTGRDSVCVGDTVMLSPSVGGGTWAAAGTHISATGGRVRGLSSGTDTALYTISNICSSVTGRSVVTVITSPVAASLAGSRSVCAGDTTTLTPSVAGGTWSRANATASVTGGLVTGLRTGIDTIFYTLSNTCGTTRSSLAIAIDSIPNPGAITGGASSLCLHDSMTLASTVSGGSWGAIGTHISVSALGHIAGTAVGADTVLYIVRNTCGADSAFRAVTVLPLPVAGTITGATALCQGDTTRLTDTPAGGRWVATSSAATLSSAGLVTGTAGGTATVWYIVTNSCGADTAVHSVVVTALPVAGAITGADTLCIGDTAVLGAAISGGTWVSAASTSLSVSASGTATAVAPGSAAIRYIIANSCGADTAVHNIYVKSLADCTLDVGTTSGSDRITVVPNPTSGRVTIGWNATATHVTRVTITSVTGVKILEVANYTSGSQLDINLSAFADGVYFYSIYTTKGVETGKVLLQH